MPTKAATQEKYQLFAEALIQTGEPARAAKLAGYTGTTKVLAVTASKLAKKPEIKKMIAARRKELKTRGELAVNDPQVLLEKLRVGTEEKREFLWDLAHDCRKIVYKEDIDEHTEADGTKVRTIRITESVFRPREAIECIVAMNEMDGDIAPPKEGGGGGPHLTIEQLLLVYNQAKND